MAMTKCHQVTSIIFGVCEIILGIVLVIFSFIFASETNIKIQYTPYWVGFPYLLPGILMIVAGAAKNQGCMVAAMVFNILLTILSGVPAGIMTIAWVDDDFSSRCSAAFDGYQTTVSCEDSQSLVVIIAIVSYACAALAFASSIVGCAATCCAPSDQPQVVILAQSQPGIYLNTTTSGGVALGAYGPDGFGGYMPTHDKASLVV